MCEARFCVPKIAAQSQISNQMHRINCFNRIDWTNHRKEASIEPHISISIREIYCAFTLYSFFFLVPLIFHFTRNWNFESTSFEWTGRRDCFFFVQFRIQIFGLNGDYSIRVKVHGKIIISENLLDAKNKNKRTNEKFTFQMRDEEKKSKSHSQLSRFRWKYANCKWKKAKFIWVKPDLILWIF